MAQLIVFSYNADLSFRAAIQNVRFQSVERSFAAEPKTQGQFAIALSDYVSGVGSDGKANLRPWRPVAIRSPYGILDWAGMINAVECSGGAVTCHLDGALQFLARHTTAGDFSIENEASGLAFQHILGEAGRTGCPIISGRVDPGTGPVNLSAVGNVKCSDAISRLVQAAPDMQLDWEVVAVAPSLAIKAHWQRKASRDQRAVVHLIEGVNCEKYPRWLEDGKAQHNRWTFDDGRVLEDAAAVGQWGPVPEPVSSRDTQDGGSLDVQLRDDLRRNSNPRLTAELTLTRRDITRTIVEWNQIAIGDLVRVVLPSVSSGLSGIAEVLAMAPDEAKGQFKVVVLWRYDLN